MPELPEVETIREDFQGRFLGRKIAGVSIGNESRLRSPFPENLKILLTGTEFTGTLRHGKYLLAGTERGGYLVFHFGMTGRLDELFPSDPAPRFCRVTIRFQDGGGLSFSDMRRLGSLAWTDGVGEFLRLKDLGPDAMDPELDPDRFEKIFEHRRALLKPSLMNQTLIAGIGNLYADEILFQNGIHPRVRIPDLPAGIFEALHGSMRDVLALSIRLHADFSRFPDRYLLFDRRAGRGCPHCPGKLEGIRIQGRTAVFCPGHQG